VDLISDRLQLLQREAIGVLTVRKRFIHRSDPTPPPCRGLPGASIDDLVILSLGAR
jgi:hypothetical protein